MATPDFNQTFALWMKCFYENMKGSADLRAEMHELVTDMDVTTEVTDEQAKIIKMQIMELNSLYHLIDRNSEKFKAFTQLFAKE